MATIKADGHDYPVDADGFLADNGKWDRNFAGFCAAQCEISDGLTGKHWDVINYIRRIYTEEGRCPLVYETCRDKKLNVHDLQALFPTGYLRGACKIAGVTYADAFIGKDRLEDNIPKMAPTQKNKTYHVDVRGFLIDPDEWDERFAVFKAYEMKAPDILTEKHWNLIYFLREFYHAVGRVPNLFETCNNLKIGLEELERLFPEGYHRNAVKLAGLRVKPE